MESLFSRQENLHGTTQCFISREVEVNDVLWLSWMTWDGESLIIILCFPPNMAICENLIKPKVPNLSPGKQLLP